MNYQAIPRNIVSISVMKISISQSVESGIFPHMFSLSSIASENL